ncbi:hypothetical protein C7B62_01120 [Pleurocapsa sp. CCALA 161]|uniref:HpsJ-like protein, cyanoexosortase A-associated n=1 Tax=Pleurocapsa sp. CCALA 161 TaxID=2107688 RepID=UPI000D0512E2|nr:HpsJ family protein [Pleurocapsa sp. CCALA 161]PSB12714.1 hypothetical protein C7B62_01120 [Pleurocapsa sp. CCALA 161]
MTILQSQARQVFYSSIWRLVGYGLLLIAIINLLFLLIKAEITPLSELQTIIAIMERIPVALLGMVLIFYGQKGDRSFVEAIILKFLSWFSLIAAVVLILVIPVNINNGWQIYHQHNATANGQLVMLKDNIQQFKEQLTAANSKNEISALLQQQAKQIVNIPESANIEKLKTDLIANLQNNQDNIKNQEQPFREQKRSLLLKQCLRCNFGALISSILFLMIWKSTEWAR